MKRLKTIGLIAAVAVMATACSASATVLTSPTGTTLPAGTEIHTQLKENTHATLHSPAFDLTCKQSTRELETTNTGSISETVQSNVVSASYSDCGCPVKVVKNGTTEIHTEKASSNYNSLNTGSGEEIETSCEGITCIWTTSKTTLSTMSGGSPAVITTNATVARTGGSFLCGSTGTWTGVYVVTSPKPLFID